MDLDSWILLYGLPHFTRRFLCFLVSISNQSLEKSFIDKSFLWISIRGSRGTFCQTFLKVVLSDFCKSRLQKPKNPPTFSTHTMKQSTIQRLPAELLDRIFSLVVPNLQVDNSSKKYLELACSCRNFNRVLLRSKFKHPFLIAQAVQAQYDCNWDRTAARMKFYQHNPFIKFSDDALESFLKEFAFSGKHSEQFGVLIKACAPRMTLVDQRGIFRHNAFNKAYEEEKMIISYDKFLSWNDFFVFFNCIVCGRYYNFSEKIVPFYVIKSTRGNNPLEEENYEE